MLMWINKEHSGTTVGHVLLNKPGNAAKKYVRFELVKLLFNRTKISLFKQSGCCAKLSYVEQERH